MGLCLGRARSVPVLCLGRAGSVLFKGFGPGSDFGPKTKAQTRTNLKTGSARPFFNPGWPAQNQLK